MWNHESLTHKEVKSRLKNREIKLAGNRKLKIYGSLSCASGKRMKKENRVFFKNKTEAIQLGFRPCGNCLPIPYQKRKILFSRRLL
jgi:methylphosphotriester-DNA--protein-cysteine methyltransferase